MRFRTRSTGSPSPLPACPPIASWKSWAAASAEPRTAGAFGQPRSLTHESGARVFFGSPRPEQPVVVNVPGEVCDDWSKEATTWARDLHATVTRLDLAADLGPSDKARGRLLQMRRAWLRRQVETRMAPTSHQFLKDEGPDQGCTCYFGGKTSDLQLRAYDRRGPLRLEFQFRPDRQVGRVLPGIIESQGVASMWRSLAYACVFPMDWYQALLKGRTLELRREVREATALEESIEQFRQQLGSTIWAYQQLGITLADLARAPEAPMRGDLAVKLLRWAKEGSSLGYDGAKLAAEVKCRLK